MLKKIINSKSAFTRFFMEADNENQEDEVEVTTAEKNAGGKEKKLTARIGGSDYTKAADAAADAADEEPIVADTTGPDDEDGATDYTDDAENAGNADNDDTTADTGTTDNADNTDTAQDGNPDNDNPDNAADDTANADDNGEQAIDATDAVDNPDDDTAADDGTGDEGVDDDESATDYTDDVDSDGTGDTAETGDGAAPQNQPDEGANDEKLGEKRKKYVMYTRFLKLHNSIDSFITKLHAIVKDDVTENAVIKIVSNNLIALKNNIYEYMVAKYKDASYVEIHIFYETAINCVRLNFSLLATNNINIQNN